MHLQAVLDTVLNRSEGSSQLPLSEVEQAVAEEVVVLPITDSFLITFLAYNPATRQLVLEFKGQTRYAYDGVPPRLVAELLVATSRGQYFNPIIKPRYAARRLQVRIGYD